MGSIKRNKNHSTSLKIDLEKAFNKVSIDGFLNLPIRLGVTGKMLDIKNTILRNRTIFIQTGGFQPDCNETKTGLPQGSVKSPLPFIIYIIELWATHANSLIFADDTSVLVTVETLEDLQLRSNSTCREIESWCR